MTVTISCRRQAADLSALSAQLPADLLEQALCERQRILIVGDFDADGATSSAFPAEILPRRCSQY